MNTEHTPAPWRLSDHGYKIIIDKPGDGYITRDVCRLDGSTVAAFAQRANAHLIAAAPDLLAALEDITKHIHMDIGMQRRAQDAIDKARGAK